MTAQLFRILKINPRPVITNPPGKNIGGFVYVMEHWYNFERYWYFSVNHQSQSGDTGWQSERIYSPEEAQIAAQVLAEYLGAELVR